MHILILLEMEMKPSAYVEFEWNLFISSPEAKYYWINKEIFWLFEVLFRQKKGSTDLEL